jgi:hypothetical protein
MKLQGNLTKCIKTTNNLLILYSLLSKFYPLLTGKEITFPTSFLMVKFSLSSKDNLFETKPENKL